MALENRIESLQKRHSEIELMIKSVNARPAPDEDLLQHLKREKLTLKDELTRLISEQEEEQAA